MYKYTLPSGATIDLERVADAMLEIEEYPQLYLDTKTGGFIEMSTQENLCEWIKDIGASKRYLHIEIFGDEARNDLASEFIHELLSDMESQYVKGADKALGKGGWQRMEKYLSDETGGCIHMWDQFLYDAIWETAEEWITSLPGISVKEEFIGYNDCEICRVMATGEDADPKKLFSAFTTQNVMNNVKQQMEKYLKNKKLNKDEPPSKVKSAATKHNKKTEQKS